uniref:Uncharacterized protein n=1 Tax=Tanacetum cinerariifolium TaxID=118510 RepID=A0A6L2N2S4_TANCI|nr:hypothetical protein [Tanacetum cinerariifolium]
MPSNTLLIPSFDVAYSIFALILNALGALKQTQKLHNFILETKTAICYDQRRFSGILWKVEECLGSPWNVLESVGRHRRDDDKDDDEAGGDDEHESDEETQEEERFDRILQTPKDSEDESDGGEDLGLNIGKEERHDEVEEEDKLYRDPESLSVSSQFVTRMLNPTLDVGIESFFETTSQIDVQTPTSVAPLPITTPTMTSSTIATTTQTSQAPTLPTIILSEVIQHLPSFGSLFRFDDRLRSLEQNFFEVMQTN